MGSLWDVRYRNDRCVGVKNRRIAGQLDRGDMMRTKDVSKAVQLAKKYFGKKTPVELINEARGEAKDVLSHAVWSQDRKQRDVREALLGSAHSFLYRDGVAQFRAYLADQPDSAKLLKHYDNFFEINSEKTIVDAVNTAFKANNTCIIVLDGGTYTVKNKEESLITYTDETLPDHLRGKLGLLKLVNVKQIVGGVGCRVTSTVFVVMLDEEAQC